MGLSTESIGDALGFILQGIPALSPDATDFIRKCPREARHAVAVALEAAAAQYAMGFSRGVPDQLRWYVARRNADDYHAWRQAGRITTRGLARHGLRLDRPETASRMAVPSHTA